jgi:fructuronate reductase
VDDVGPFEQRKLWLLNGSHSLLAYAGSIRGHETVAAAIADPVVRSWVEEWWDEAAGHLTLGSAEVTAYRRALVTRFANPRIRHVLAQIAADGSQKVPVRVVPVLRAELAAGRLPGAASRVVAAWVCHLRGLGAPIKDARAAEVAPFGAGSLEESVERTLAFLGADLAADDRLRERVVAAARDLEGQAGTAHP